MSTIYAGNYVNQELVNQVEKELITEGMVKVSFSVTGRTKHYTLSKQLEAKLPHFEFEIGDNYECMAIVPGWTPCVGAEYTIPELKEKAKDYQIQGYSKMKKEELVSIINHKVKELNDKNLCLFNEAHA